MDWYANANGKWFLKNISVLSKFECTLYKLTQYLSFLC